MVALVSQSSSFLTRAPRTVKTLVQGVFTGTIIDVPGMGSHAAAANKAAIGKRQVNFILSTEEQND